MPSFRFLAPLLLSLCTLVPGRLPGQPLRLTEPFEIAPPRTSPWPSVLSTTDVDGESGVGSPVLARLGNGFVAVQCQGRYAGADLWFRRFLADGQAMDPESRRLGDAPDDRIDCEPEFLAAATAVGIDDTNHVVVIWGKAGGAVQGRRYDPDGNPLGGPFSIAGATDAFALAVQPGGGFVVAGSSTAPAGQPRPLWLRRFTAAGLPDGPAAEVCRSTAWRQPVLAADRYGNLALFWMEDARPALALFNAQLAPQGPVAFDPAVRVASRVDRGGVALSDDGRILTVWLGLKGTRVRDSVLGRLWQARKDADLCVFRDGRFLCDTSNNGGNAELRLRFGQPGDVPLLADVDGDGRADPCVFRNQRFLCDTAHDGGAAETERAFPGYLPPGGQPLLGDLDHDDNPGADPCYRLGSRWACLIWNQIIGTHMVSWDFGTGDEPGLFGDVNGDGTSEACLFRQGRFRCQIWNAQAGRYDKRTFDLHREIGTSPAGTPLLGDVDGDGRDDPCVYNAGRLVCGIFAPGASLPARFVRQSFGVAGDLPLLGNVDGF
jgi:hypothetical protein